MAKSGSRANGKPESNRDANRGPSLKRIRFLTKNIVSSSEQPCNM